MNKYRFLNEHFLNNNLKIFPLYENGKIPLVSHWKEDASCDKAQVVYWLENAKNCNWALPSTLNNLFVIDIDMHGDVDGLESFVNLCDSLGLKYGTNFKTLFQTTPSGGIHLIFKSDEELNKVKNKANFFKGYPGIDIRTDGYIAVEPSVIDGRLYSFDGDGDMNDIEEMPQKLREYILECNSDNENTEKSVESLYELDKVVTKGSRDDTIFNYINGLYNNTKLNYNEILALALAYNRDCFDPPLKDRDIEYKVRRMFKSERSKIFTIRISEEVDE